MDLVYSVRCIGAFSYIDIILDNKTLLCFMPLPYHVVRLPKEDEIAWRIYLLYSSPSFPGFSPAYTDATSNLIVI